MEAEPKKTFSGIDSLDDAQALKAIAYELPDSKFWDVFTPFFRQNEGKGDSACRFPLFMGALNGEWVVEDIYDRANVLIAGTIGSGKTGFIYNQLAFLLLTRTPETLKILGLGSKTIDYGFLNLLGKHFLLSETLGVKTQPEFLALIEGLISELSLRHKLFSLAGVKTIAEYNSWFSKGDFNSGDPHKYLPDVLLFIDDLFSFVKDEAHADVLIKLMQQNVFTGIYVIAATSQLHATLLGRKLRSNFVLRIARKVMAQSDSRKILDSTGAEQLEGPGKLIYKPGHGKVISVPEISFDSLINIVQYISGQKSGIEPYALHQYTQATEFDPNELDRYFEEAARLVVLHQQGSTSLIQRKLKLGYNRAGRIMDQLESLGIVSAFNGMSARTVLMPDEYSLEQFLDTLQYGKGVASLKKWHQPTAPPPELSVHEPVIIEPVIKQDKISLPTTPPEIGVLERMLNQVKKLFS